MANLRELRRRIRSVKNTAQITKAMQMVAATKMRRAQVQALSGRPYNQSLNDILGNLMENIRLRGSKKLTHALMEENSAENAAVLLLTTDKPLCGALNTNVLRLPQSFAKEHPNTVFYTIGRKGRQFVVKTGKILEADIENHEKVTFQQAYQVGRMLIKEFLAKKLAAVHIIYPDFVSTLRQEPKLVQLLPVSRGAQVREELGAQEEKKGAFEGADYIIEPSKEKLLSYALYHFVEVVVYQAMLETKASEHSARMIAMQNATDNAKQLVSDLQLLYNQTRQEAITTELLEITSAAAALE